MTAPLVVVASGNRGKLRELRAILRGLPFALRPQSDFGLESPEETGSTFVENALLKARHVCRETGLAAIADDSGLAVDALDGAPGIRSARYAGDDADDARNLQKLLAELRAFPDDALSACFHCAAVWLRAADDPQPVVAEARWCGRITREPRGDQGFGYDPVFYLPQHRCTAAQLPPAVKNEISHRARAFGELRGHMQAPANVAAR
ncbi:MAG: RdgB/HAM1 family non-canonical purine NTP pyrophosphatase [Gammaproteobacteria bacterium]|nr:RdgB/HAM1 family non-canonical purine NTP pyrophosphatase [Gammaproteobacteria bacterium]